MESCCGWGGKKFASTVLGDLVKRKQALEPSAHASHHEDLSSEIRTCKKFLKLQGRLETFGKVGHTPTPSLSKW